MIKLTLPTDNGALRATFEPPLPDERVDELYEYLCDVDSAAELSREIAAYAGRYGVDVQFDPQPA